MEKMCIRDRDEAVEKMKETVLNQTEAAMYPYGYRAVSYTHLLLEKNHIESRD